MRRHTVQVTVEIQISDDYDSIMEDIGREVIDEAKKQISEAMKSSSKQSRIIAAKVSSTIVEENGKKQNWKWEDKV